MYAVNIRIDSSFRWHWHDVDYTVARRS